MTSTVSPTIPRGAWPARVVLHKMNNILCKEEKESILTCAADLIFGIEGLWIVRLGEPLSPQFPGLEHLQIKHFPKGYIFAVRESLKATFLCGITDTGHDTTATKVAVLLHVLADLQSPDYWNKASVRKFGGKECVESMLQCVLDSFEMASLAFVTAEVAGNQVPSGGHYTGSSEVKEVANNVAARMRKRADEALKNHQNGGIGKVAGGTMNVVGYSGAIVAVLLSPFSDGVSLMALPYFEIAYTTGNLTLLGNSVAKWGRNRSILEENKEDHMIAIDIFSLLWRMAIVVAPLLSAIEHIIHNPILFYPFWSTFKGKLRCRTLSHQTIGYAADLGDTVMLENNSSELSHIVTSSSLGPIVELTSSITSVCRHVVDMTSDNPSRPLSVLAEKWTCPLPLFVADHLPSSWHVLWTPLSAAKSAVGLIYAQHTVEEGFRDINATESDLANYLQGCAYLIEEWAETVARSGLLGDFAVYNHHE
ncbi:hypothetical protein Pelo_10935 [Pelomyxa schiedti]|nr:hypothetical protein Pelo_10935 [Pelomyxa schiedti]